MEKYHDKNFASIDRTSIDKNGKLDA